MRAPRGCTVKPRDRRKAAQRSAIILIRIKVVRSLQV
jgi:hypothetical protein